MPSQHNRPLPNHRSARDLRRPSKSGSSAGVAPAPAVVFLGGGGRIDSARLNHFKNSQFAIPTCVSFQRIRSRCTSGDKVMPPEEKGREEQARAAAVRQKKT